jgi:hypothetical protein
MIKKAKPRTPATNAVDEAGVAIIASFLTKLGNTALSDYETRRQNYADDIQNRETSMKYHTDEIIAEAQRIKKVQKSIKVIEAEIEKLPPAKVITVDETHAELAKVIALPFIAGVRLEKINARDYIIATTRPDTLYTTYTKKWSMTSARFYRAKAYKVPMPIYDIRIGTIMYSTLSNTEKSLALTLAEYKSETADFQGGGRYSQEPHAHWGTQHIGTHTDYSKICLGEYESEVTKAFKKSLADGLIALSVYLQTAGARNGYVNSREVWGLWLGKKEINALLVAKPAEDKKLQESGERVSADDSDEDGDECSCYEDGDRDNGRQCDDDCECDCHNN